MKMHPNGKASFQATENSFTCSGAKHASVGRPVFLLEARGQSAPCPSQLLDAACVPGRVAPGMGATHSVSPTLVDVRATLQLEGHP